MTPPLHLDGSDVGDEGEEGYGEGLDD